MASWRTWTSPAAGANRGTSWSSSTSGPPWACTWTARVRMRFLLDDLEAPELGDLVVAESKFSQDILAAGTLVLERPGDACGCACQPRCLRHDGDFAAAGVLHLDEDARMDRLRIGIDLVHAKNRPGGNIRCSQRMVPLLSSFTCEGFLENAVEGNTIAQPIRVGCVVGVVSQRRTFDGFCQAAPLLVPAHRDVEIAIECPVCVGRDSRGMFVS